MNSSNPDPQPPQQLEKKVFTRETRFNVSLLVLVTLALGQTLLQSLETKLGVIAHVAMVLLAAFAYEWNIVHATALTRHKRAFFDVSNVLETYQPRARTMGHLFQPEPPTPGLVKFEVSSTTTEDSKNAAFNKARDSHYADMFEHCMKASKESELMQKAADLSASNTSADTPLVPADPAKDKSEHEQKQKKEIEDYKKQLEKPFTC